MAASLIDIALTQPAGLRKDHFVCPTSHDRLDYLWPSVCLPPLLPTTTRPSPLHLELFSGNLASLCAWTALCLSFFSALVPVTSAFALIEHCTKMGTRSRRIDLSRVVASWPWLVSYKLFTSFSWQKCQSVLQCSACRKQSQCNTLIPLPIKCQWRDVVLKFHTTLKAAPISRPIARLNSLPFNLLYSILNLLLSYYWTSFQFNSTARLLRFSSFLNYAFQTLFNLFYWIVTVMAVKKRSRQSQASLFLLFFVQSYWNVHSLFTHLLSVQFVVKSMCRVSLIASIAHFQ